MPYKPKRPCGYPGCPEVTGDRFCEPHRKLMEARYNKYDRDPDTAKRYGRTWRLIREMYISEHPMCEKCLEQDRPVPAEEVHHILPLANGGTHDTANLMSLCSSCHSRITAKDGGRWKRGGR